MFNIIKFFNSSARFPELKVDVSNWNLTLLYLCLVFQPKAKYS